MWNWLRYSSIRLSDTNNGSSWSEYRGKMTNVFDHRRLDTEFESRTNRTVGSCLVSTTTTTTTTTTYKTCKTLYIFLTRLLEDYSIGLLQPYQNLRYHASQRVFETLLAVFRIQISAMSSADKQQVLLCTEG